MGTKCINSLTQVANYLKVKPGKITLDSSSIPTRSLNNDTTKGFINIIVALINESKADLIGRTPEDRAEVLQWIEYALIYGSKCSTQQAISDLLSGLNGVLSTRTYLVSSTISAADIVLYYAIYTVIDTITYLEKEKFVNVCRWFDNLQQNQALRQSNKVIDFSTNFLSTAVPARH